MECQISITKDGWPSTYDRIRGCSLMKFTRCYADDKKLLLIYHAAVATLGQLQVIALMRRSIVIVPSYSFAVIATCLSYCNTNLKEHE